MRKDQIFTPIFYSNFDSFLVSRTFSVGISIGTIWLSAEQRRVIVIAQSQLLNPAIRLNSVEWLISTVAFTDGESAIEAAK